MTAVTALAGRWWMRLRWPLYAGLLLSILSLLELTGLPFISWLGSLGIVAVVVALWLDNYAAGLNPGLVFFVGFCASVLAWALVLYGVAGLVRRLTRRRSVAN